MRLDERCEHSLNAKAKGGRLLGNTQFVSADFCRP